MDSPHDIPLRDFIYLDVDRLKSLLSQLDSGLLIERTDIAGSASTAGGRGHVGIPGLVEVGGVQEYVSNDESSETRSMHDFVFSQTERLLVERNRIKRLPQDYAATRILNREFRASLSPTEYVLVKGRVTISDYKYLSKILENINDLIGVTARFGKMEELQGSTQNQRSKIENELKREIEQAKLDPGQVKGIQKIIDIFMSGRLLFRVFPFIDYPNIRVVAPLAETSLRETMDDIRFKFGSSPRASWTVFGQVAAVPLAGDEPPAMDLKFANPLEKAMEAFFATSRGIEDVFKVSFPEIAVTPIAIYRD